MSTNTPYLQVVNFDSSRLLGKNVAKQLLFKTRVVGLTTGHNKTISKPTCPMLWY